MENLVLQSMSSSKQCPLFAATEFTSKRCSYQSQGMGAYERVKEHVGLRKSENRQYSPASLAVTHPNCLFNAHSLPTTNHC